MLVQTIQNQLIEDPSALLAALDRGESLPAHWYTDPLITGREIEKVFRRFWAYVGPLREVAKVGEYITGYVGEVPVVVIRNESGLAAFANVCRHRRHEVMKGRGSCNVMQCGYHAWTYDLMGHLKGAPRSAHEPNFRLEDYPLVPLKVDTLGPFVFVNIDAQTKPLASYFGGLLEIIEGSGIHLDKLELYSREEWTAEANWKTMLENYLECYHCAVAHPGFSAAIDVKQEDYSLTMHGWFASQLGEVRQSALEGKTAVKIYDARGEIAQAQYHLLWPNITFNINPGFPNFSLDVWFPDGPNKTKGFSEQYFGAGVSEQFAHDLIAFNKQVGYEDDVLTNSVQKGLIGGIPDQGRFLTNSEHLCISFQRLIVQAMTQDAVSPKQEPVTTRISTTPTPSVAPMSSMKADFERNSYVELEVAKMERESATITSFYLRRADGRPISSWLPGQFLPIRVAVPGQAEPMLRTYTLSTRCNPDFYRITIRRGEGSSLVSHFMHTYAQVGFRLHAMTPRGKFVLDESDERPVVLVSGGVGVTPMMAITEHIVEQGVRTGKYRPIYFIHGTQNSGVQAFGKQLRELATRHPSLKLHFCFSDPDASDKIGITYDTEGRISTELLNQILPPGDYDYYLCGPSQFMNILYGGLTANGVPPERIFYESFGPGTVLKPEIPKKPAEEHVATPVRVKFAKSGIESEWSHEDGTLLELAEEAGLAPAFGCRLGICGTCRTKIISGGVDYLEEPMANRALDEILLCCSVPREDRTIVGAREAPDVVLDL